MLSRIKNQPRVVSTLLALVVLFMPLELLSNTFQQQFDGKFSINHKQTRMMQFEKLKRVDIGNPEIISVSMEPGSSHFILVGIAPGKTDVTLWGDGNRIKRYEIRVKGDERFAERETLAFLLAGIEGVLLGELQNDERFTISGKPSSIADYEQVMELVSRYDNVVARLKKPAFDKKPTVRMRIKYLEISSIALSKFGIDWDNLMSGINIGVQSTFTGSPFSGSGNTSSSLSISTSLSAAIKNLIQNGDARVLKEQSVLVESGATGSLFTGGEFPVNTRGENNSVSTEYKPFGMSLQIQPVVNNSKQVNTSINFEMSSIDPSSALRGNPTLKTTQHSTKVTLEDRKAIMIADFVGSDDAKTVKKLPGLGHIPVFGELFKSREFQRNKTELYVLLEPEIVRMDTVAVASEFFSEKSKTALQSTRFKLLD